ICLMKLRQRNRYSAAPVEDRRMEFSQIEDREDRIVLETAFRVLSEEERQIIMLHAVSGLKHREISELLQRPLSTVLSRYSRGIKKLRRELEGML
ncbi:MAG: sigma-70 family RNA polymerase sigma factor, partial [Oscillospiraceae bacterium]|nr:sigma-70 family RNA polymerase sigma factor [Oscillospiraceae bacterium]